MVRSYVEPDVYWHKDYVYSAAEIEQGRPVFLKYTSSDATAFISLIVSEIPGTSFCDAVTPYGFSGPLVGPLDDLPPSFWVSLDDWCRANHIVRSFMRFHPLTSNACHRPNSIELMPLAGTVAWPIGGTGDLLMNMHPKHRNMVRRAMREEIEVTIRTAPSSLDEFIALYEDTMTRRFAAPKYFFSERYWDSLKLLGSRLLLAEARKGPALLSSSLCLAGPRWLHYHLAASAEEDSLGASQLMLLRLAEWGRKHEKTIFHLGSGVAGCADTLLRFKRRFAPHEPLREFVVGTLKHQISP